MSEWTTGAKRKVELGIFCANARENVVRLEDELARAPMGSKDCCLSNFTLFLIILIYNAVKDLMLGHLNFILGPRSFSNHELVFKFLTLYQIKMTQKWINVVDTGSNRVHTMSF